MRAPREKRYLRLGNFLDLVPPTVGAPEGRAVYLRAAPKLVTLYRGGGTTALSNEHDVKHLPGVK